jgi:YkoY family integral membrane protein
LRARDEGPLFPGTIRDFSAPTVLFRIPRRLGTGIPYENASLFLLRGRDFTLAVRPEQQPQGIGASRVRFFWRIFQPTDILPGFGLFAVASESAMLFLLIAAGGVSLGLWHQTFSASDMGVVGLLVLLEGVLSIDNALVLGLLARRVPKHLQKRALTYGLVGAFVFRILAVATASFLLRWRIVKLLGGAYLIYIAVKHLFFESKEQQEEVLSVDAEGEPQMLLASGAPLSPEQELVEIQERVPFPLPEELQQSSSQTSPAAATKTPTSSAAVGARPLSSGNFWTTVAVIELTDIAFAVDSILAAIALVGSAPADHPANAPHPKLWVVIAGGVIGLMLMRVAAALFIRLLEKFPRFEVAAYLLVIVIGLKLLVDWGFNRPGSPYPVDFHSYRTPEFWVFWISMLVALCVGFLPKKPASESTR